MTELTTGEIESARRTLHRSALADLTPGEVAVELERWKQHKAVLATHPPSATRDGGLRYAERRIADITAYANRLIQAKVTRSEPPKPDFDRAKYVDLVGLVQTALAQDGRKQGPNWVFHCPWHGSDREPSLTVFPLHKGGWYCFGCGRGGSDAASFMAERYGCSQLEGLRWVEQLCDL